jgi:hypothetical protein
MDVFFGLFFDKEDVEEEFYVEIGDVQIIYAEYSYQDYEGEAFVLFVEKGIIYEVNGSHCSCMGLEGQWSPEENDYAAIMARPNIPQQAKDNLKKFFGVIQ